MRGYLTSFWGLFDGSGIGLPSIRAVEIPIIQRDFAQGRRDSTIDDVRAAFLEVLIDAIADGGTVGLDFVYGRTEAGVLHPVDGQQRLTTLFLLHWYVASRAHELHTDQPWTRFTYETRPSARLFCERLSTNPLPESADCPSRWITDQPWYQYLWKNDPTIQSMLVMLDSIDCRITTVYPELDFATAWRRLIDPLAPAITFYLLPLDDLSSDEELYIKMNSRGKPLTPFENFKARFEQDISYSPRAVEFADKVDGPWSNLLWPIHGGDFIVDDEFMRYIDFATEICEFKEGTVAEGRLGSRARAVFGSDNVAATQNLDFLFACFDAWEDFHDVQQTFDHVFQTAVPGDSAYDSGKVTLFGVSDVNLMEQCCHSFDSQELVNRKFTLQQSLLLYATLIHKVADTKEFARRARILRNLIAASEDEIRRQSMPALLRDVEYLITSGQLDGVKTFNRSQLDDEQIKRAFLTAHPELMDIVFRLEDNPLLRGTLHCWDFEPEGFLGRAEAFESAFGDPSQWALLTGALLTAGDYQRQRPGSSGWQFGTGSIRHESVWRYLLAGAPRDSLRQTRVVLAAFLDDLAASTTPASVHWEKSMESWLRVKESQGNLDWRYYLVKYPQMRGGATGIYFGEGGRLGYSLCMLRTKTLHGFYRDPFLLQIWLTSGVGDAVEDPWFTGYESTARWLRLVKSWIGVRVVGSGFELQVPTDERVASLLDDTLRGTANVERGEHTILVRVPQQITDGVAIDSEDRVLIGAELLRTFVNAGL